MACDELPLSNNNNVSNTNFLVNLGNDEIHRGYTLSGAEH